MSTSRLNALVNEAGTGSLDALAELLQRYRPMLLKKAAALLSKQLSIKVSGSDVVQQTSVDAIRSLSDLRATNDDEFRAWLFTLLNRNLQDTVRKYLQSQKRQLIREQSLSENGSRAIAASLICQRPTPDQHALEREALDRATQALDRLPAEYRLVLELTQRDRLTYPQIAIVLGKTADAVRMTFNRAIAQFARELQADDRPGA